MITASHLQKRWIVSGFAGNNLAYACDLFVEPLVSTYLILPPCYDYSLVLPRPLRLAQPELLSILCLTLFRRRLASLVYGFGSGLSLTVPIPFPLSSLRQHWLARVITLSPFPLCLRLGV